MSKKGSKTMSENFEAVQVVDEAPVDYDTAQSNDIGAAWLNKVVMLRKPLSDDEQRNRVVIFQNGRVVADFIRQQEPDGAFDTPVDGLISLVNDRPSMTSLKKDSGFLQQKLVNYNTLTGEIVRVAVPPRHRK